MDVVGIGAGPAGVLAASRAAELGARTVLVTPGDFVAMAANDGPVSVWTFAQAARLLREARQLRRMASLWASRSLIITRLLGRMREVSSPSTPVS
jgi:pyruvate/2-oxoglutarate dehydrogenase complex dihydrolipoamide dehydrogenase (E3) component